MDQTNFMQVFQRMKNEVKKLNIYFALESVEDEYGGPIRSVLALAALSKSEGYNTIIIQANTKLKVQKNSFSRFYNVITAWSF